MRVLEPEYTDIRSGVQPGYDGIIEPGYEDIRAEVQGY